MGLIELVIVLIILGVALYLIETLVPMDPAIKTAVRVLVLLVILLWLLRIILGGALLPGIKLCP